MTSELAERLRGANPVPTAEAIDPDESLLSRIVAMPQRSTTGPTRRFSRRRVVTVLAGAVIAIGGIAAAASRFAPDYFGSDDSEPTPAAVLAQLRSLARVAPQGGLGEIEEEGLVRLAAFDTDSGRATVYAAPVRGGASFCSVRATGEETTGGGCKGPTDEDAIPHMGSGSSEWGDVRVLLGRLVTPAARIEVSFEDGAVRAASIRAPWWVYVVGGDETEPGRRPIGLTALDPGEAVVATQELDPYYFTSERAAEALLPESDGSLGQNAIRAMLEGLGAGVEPVLPVEIDRTRLLRRIETPEGTFDVYSAPSRNGVCFALAHSRLSVGGTTGCPYEDPSHPNRRATFEVEPSSIRPVRHSIFTVDGTPPAASARVEVRFEDGTSAPADILVRSFFAAWSDPSASWPAVDPLSSRPSTATGRRSLRSPSTRRCSGRAEGSSGSATPRGSYASMGTCPGTAATRPSHACTAG